MSSFPNLTWIDLEMTGLNPEKEVIIEMAIIITDDQLNIIDEMPEIAVSQPSSYLDAMDDWNQTHHSQTGLIERVKQSNISNQIAEAMALEFIKPYVSRNQSPLCGNSVGHDRRFLVKYMPKLENYLHYRNIDVSSVKELAKRWNPNILKHFSKQNRHSALSDIKESIDELRYYKQTFFKLPEIKQ